MPPAKSKEPEHVSVIKAVKDRVKEAENILSTIPKKIEYYEMKAFEKHLAPKGEKGKEIDPDKWNWDLLDASKEGYLGDKIAEDIINNYKSDIDKIFKDDAAKRIKKAFLDTNYGVSVQMYKEAFEQAGKNYKESEIYKQKIGVAKKILKDQMDNHIIEPLKVEHINDILKHIGADQYLVDVKNRKGIKRRIYLPGLATLIQTYDDKKGIPINAVDLTRAGFENYLKDNYAKELGVYGRPDPAPSNKKK